MVDRLPFELLRFIGLKLVSAADRIRFRAVSKYWRTSLPFLRHPPLLMVISKSHNAVEFIHAGEHTVSKGHFVGTEMKMKLLQTLRVVGSTGNWAIFDSSEPRRIHLLNPYSRAEFQLTSEFKIPSGDTRECTLFITLVKSVLSWSPLTGDFVAMAIMNMHSWGVLAISRPGDECWTGVELNPHGFDDVVFYQQRFYAITSRGEILACDIGDGSKPPQFLSLFHCLVDLNMFAKRKHYLVEVLGELVMVVRFLDSDLSDYKRRNRTIKFKMYKLDLENIKFDEFKCLYDHSLFLGLNTSASVLVPDYFGMGLVRRNCIYFADDVVYESRYNLIYTVYEAGVFDLEDNSITPHYRGTSNNPAAVWIVPQ